MIKHLVSLLTILIAGLTIGCPRVLAEEIVTTLTGTVAPECGLNHVILMKVGSHPSLGKQISIPVEDGKFSYILRDTVTEVYALYPQTHIGFTDYHWFFFNENGNVDFKVFKNESGANTLEILAPMPETRSYHDQLYASSHVDEYLQYTAFADSVYSGKNEISADMKSRLEDMGKNAIAAYERNNQEFIASGATLPGLFMIAQTMWAPKEQSFANYADIYDKFYRGRFDGHPYVSQIEESIRSFRSKANIPGNRYTDVEALDADGNMRKLSEFIDGKVALINLWASWCGPCRRHSMELIPIYNEFAPKGFAVVGIGREARSDKFMRHVVEQDKYPWPCLAEIDDSTLIWTKFGIPNAPGRILLVDKEGTILAIDPTPEEIRQKLNELL